MFDFVGVCDYHGDDEEMAEGGLVITTPKKKKYEPRHLLALDINNLIDPTTREWITIDESGNMVFPEASEQKAAELGTSFEAWLLGQEELTPNEESWLRVIGNQLRANADTLDEFSLAHFAFPPFTLMGGVMQATRVFGGEDRLETFLTGLNEAVFKQATEPRFQTAEEQQPVH
ncbi:MAG: type I restriction-modification enzyme R subunit C-terminal domain-containing protein [Syntrophobacteraceae bacterium]